MKGMGRGGGRPMTVISELWPQETDTMSRNNFFLFGALPSSRQQTASVIGSHRRNSFGNACGFGSECRSGSWGLVSAPSCPRVILSGTQHKTGGAGDEVAGQRVIQQASSEGSMPRPGGAHWVTERGKEGRRQGGRAGWQSVSR